MIIAVNFQSKQLERRSLKKKIRASTGFEPVTSALNWKFTAMVILHSHLQPQFKNELFHILHISLISGKIFFFMLSPDTKLLLGLVSERNVNIGVKS